MAFSEQQKNELLVVLGYGIKPYSQTQVLSDWLNELGTRSDLVSQITTLIETLTEIDEQLNSARSDSMAIAVGELKLDYRQHISHLKSEGSRLLRQLSALTEVAIKFDKYRGISPSSSASSISAVSYW